MYLNYIILTALATDVFLFHTHTNALTYLIYPTRIITDKLIDFARIA